MNHRITPRNIHVLKRAPCTYIFDIIPPQVEVEVTENKLIILPSKKNYVTSILSETLFSRSIDFIVYKCLYFLNKFLNI